MQLRRFEWPPRAVDETRDAVFVGFRRVLVEAVEFSEPSRVTVGLFEVEEAGIENVARIDTRVARFDDAGIGVERPDDRPRRHDVFRSRNIDFVEDDDVGKFDLLDQQLHERAFVILARDFTAILQKIPR